MKKAAVMMVNVKSGLVRIVNLADSVSVSPVILQIIYAMGIGFLVMVFLMKSGGQNSNSIVHRAISELNFFEKEGETVT